MGKLPRISCPSSPHPLLTAQEILGETTSGNSNFTEKLEINTVVSIKEDRKGEYSMPRRVLIKKKFKKN